METKEISKVDEAMAAAKESLTATAATMTATLNDTSEILKKFNSGATKIVEVKPDGSVTVEDSGIAGAMSKVTDFEFQGVPIGAAVLGGVVAVFGTELIDGMLAKQSTMIRGVVKLGGAWVVLMWGKKLIGAKAAGAVALLMAFDAIKNDLLPQPFDLATKGANKLTGVVTTAGLGWTGGAPKSVVEQANKILSSSQMMAAR